MITKNDLLKHGADKAEGFACRANHEVFSDEWIVTLSNYKLGYQAALDLLWPVVEVLERHKDRDDRLKIFHGKENYDSLFGNKDIAALALSELAEKVKP